MACYCYHHEFDELQQQQTLGCRDLPLAVLRARSASTLSWLAGTPAGIRATVALGLVRAGHLLHACRFGVDLGSGYLGVLRTAGTGAFAGSTRTLACVTAAGA